MDRLRLLQMTRVLASLAISLGLGACAVGYAGGTASPATGSPSASPSPTPQPGQEGQQGQEGRVPGEAGGNAARHGLDMTSIGDILRACAERDGAAQAARTQALLAMGPHRDARQSLELAYLLLTGAGSDQDAAARAQDLLKGLQAGVLDAGARQFLGLLQRLGRQQTELAQARADAGRADKKVAELQDKIMQIKNLERQLQGRNPSVPKTP